MPLYAAAPRHPNGQRVGLRQLWGSLNFSGLSTFRGPSLSVGLTWRTWSPSVGLTWWTRPGIRPRIQPGRSPVRRPGLRRDLCQCHWPGRPGGGGGRGASSRPPANDMHGGNRCSPIPPQHRTVAIAPPRSRPRARRSRRRVGNNGMRCRRGYGGGRTHIIRDRTAGCLRGRNAKNYSPPPPQFSARNYM